MQSKYKFLQKIDSLPVMEGMKWECEEVKVQGDMVGENGEALVEKLELWKRDPVECIRELIGNPAFRDVMGYAPERVYADKETSTRVYDEMWTGDWWWNLQVRLSSAQFHHITLQINDRKSFHKAQP